MVEIFVIVSKNYNLGCTENNQWAIDVMRYKSKFYIIH